MATYYLDDKLLTVLLKAFSQVLIIGIMTLIAIWKEKQNAILHPGRNLLHQEIHSISCVVVLLYVLRSRGRMVLRKQGETKCN